MPLVRLLVRRLRRLRHYASRTISARQMRGILMREEEGREREQEREDGNERTSQRDRARNVDRDRVLEKVGNGAARRGAAICIRTRRRKK